ncbi:hypothetical protein AB0C84_44645 [Actinomadura sp. NPDC048955]|uniref:hypothetical protein n=1 Tax=Actinomadura sp. NPDC048955 TaxID=3158228 RepID=UPI00340ACC94
MPPPATAIAGLAGDVPLLVVDLADTVASGDAAASASTRSPRICSAWASAWSLIWPGFPR